MKLKAFLAPAMIAALVLSGCGSSSSTQSTTSPASDTENVYRVEDRTLYSKQLAPPAEGETIATIKTSMGDITVRFFPEEAPLAVQSFLELAQEGYYDGVIFHRVINDFMIQGGDPTGTGRGGESAFGESFADEFAPYLHNYRGALSMANSGEDSNGSQFFIVQSSQKYEEYIQQAVDIYTDTPDAIIFNRSTGMYDFLSDIYSEEVVELYREHGGSPNLDYQHTVFGQVIDGMDVVDAIAAVEVTDNGLGEESRPAADVVIESIEIAQYSAKAES